MCSPRLPRHGPALVGAVQKGDPQEMANANEQLTGAVRGLMIAVEAYPHDQVGRRLPAAAGRARGHGESGRGLADGLQRGSAGVQHVHPPLPDRGDREGDRCKAPEDFEVTTPGAREAPKVDFFEVGARGAGALEGTEEARKLTLPCLSCVRQSDIARSALCGTCRQIHGHAVLPEIDSHDIPGRISDGRCVHHEKQLILCHLLADAHERAAGGSDLGNGATYRAKLHFPTPARRLQQSGDYGVHAGGNSRCSLRSPRKRVSRSRRAFSTGEGHSQRFGAEREHVDRVPPDPAGARQLPEA